MKCSKGIGLLMTVIAVVHAVPSETKSRYISQENDSSVTKTPLYVKSKIRQNFTNILSPVLRNSTVIPLMAKYKNGSLKKLTRIAISNSNIRSSVTVDNTIKNSSNKIFFSQPFNSKRVNHTSAITSSSGIHKISTKIPLKLTSIATTTPATRKLVMVNNTIKNSSNKKFFSQSFNSKRVNHTSVITTSADIHKISTKMPLKLASMATTTPATRKLVMVKTKVVEVTTPKTIKKQKNKRRKPNIPNNSVSIESGIPTVHRVKTKLSDSVSEIKQNWYEEGVPYPNPNPEISSSSPSFSLNELSSISPLILDSNGVSDPIITPEVTSHSPPYSISDVPSVLPAEVPELSPPSQAVGDALSVFNLDMVADATKLATGDGFPCPSVHISSAVMNPQQRQGCSDLSLVINSHIHQNAAGSGTRLPAAETYDSLPGNLADEPIAEAAGDAGVLADPGVAADPGVVGNPAVAADPGTGVAQAAAPASGGSGGTGGSGSNGDGGSWKFPDLRHMFEAMGYIWNGLGYLLSFLRNPYLYIVPMAIFFLLGFFKVLALFPWWIPILLLYLGVKNNSKPKQSVSFYQHVHKPVHHLDGWFWNKNTKTWQNVQDFHSKKDIHSSLDYDSFDSLSTDLKRIHGIYARKDVGSEKSNTKRRMYR